MQTSELRKGVTWKKKIFGPHSIRKNTVWVPKDVSKTRLQGVLNFKIILLLRVDFNSYCDDNTISSDWTILGSRDGMRWFFGF